MLLLKVNKETCLRLRYNRKIEVMAKGKCNNKYFVVIECKYKQVY